MDVRYYPDTNKWSLPGQPLPVKVLPASAYEGEE